MKKLMSVARKATTTLAALTLITATTSVPGACYHWFAQPVESEEFRKFMEVKTS